MFVRFVMEVTDQQPQQQRFLLQRLENDQHAGKVK